MLRAVSLFPHQLALSPETELRATAKAEAPPAPGRASSSRASEPGKPARSGCTGEQASAPAQAWGRASPEMVGWSFRVKLSAPVKLFPLQAADILVKAGKRAGLWSCASGSDTVSHSSESLAGASRGLGPTLKLFVTRSDQRPT